jgi:outer membrane murein-binding lipoprotein Lpp
MIINRPTVSGIVPLAALILGACVSQSAYDQLPAQDQQLQAQSQQLQAPLAQSRAEQKFVEAGDMLFPEGGFQLSQAGQAELATNIAPKLGVCRMPKSSFTVTPITARRTSTAAAGHSGQLGPFNAARFDRGEFSCVTRGEP